MAQIQMDVNTQANANVAARTQPARNTAVRENQTPQPSQAQGQRADRVQAGNTRVDTGAGQASRTSATQQTTQAAQTGRAAQELPYGRGNSVTDTAHEGVTLQAGPNIRYENSELGRVIEQRRPWSADDEAAAGQSMADQARAESEKRTEEVESRREATAQTMAERREQIEEVREQAMENREAQAVARVQAAASSADGPNAQAAVNAVTEQAERAPTTYSGISETDLERMVQTGEISQNDYDREMEARQEQQESRAEQGRTFGREMAGNVAEQQRTDRTRAEIQGLGEGNERVSAAARVQALDAADTTGRQAQESAQTAKAADLTVNIS